MKKFRNIVFTSLTVCIFSLGLYAMDVISTQEIDVENGEPFLHRVNAGVWSQVGTRHAQSEDTFLCEPIGHYFNIPRPTDYIFAVFDGHGGKKVSEYLVTYLKFFIVAAIGPEKEHNNIEKALRDAFKMADNSVRSIFRQGSTALVVLLLDDVLYIANAGDSRAIVYAKQDKEINLTITKDHKPNEESERIRIEEDGGRVIFRQGAYRVCGNLSCSRSIGDHPKDPGLSAVPEILSVKLDERYRRIVLASDGIYDVLSNERVVYLAGAGLMLSNAQKAAKTIVNNAKSKDSPDDLTAIVVGLYWH